MVGPRPVADSARMVIAMDFELELHGWGEVARFVERCSGYPVSKSCVRRWAALDVDPLPTRRDRFNNVRVSHRELREWLVRVGHVRARSAS